MEVFTRPRVLAVATVMGAFALAAPVATAGAAPLTPAQTATSVQAAYHGSGNHRNGYGNWGHRGSGNAGNYGYGQGNGYSGGYGQGGYGQGNGYSGGYGQGNGYSGGYGQGNSGGYGPGFGISGGANGGATLPGGSAGVSGSATLNPLSGLGVGASTGVGLA
jgi:hypothetical protein